MLSIDVYEDYFEALSKKEMAASFYPIDMTDFQSFLEDLRGNKVQSPAFILEDFIIKGSATNNDQVLDVVHGAVIWLEKIKERGNQKENQREAKKRTLAKIQKIKEACLADKRNFETLMYWLNTGAYEIDFTKQGEWAGYRFEFELRVPVG